MGDDGDLYLSVKALAGYSGLSVRTLRTRLVDPMQPIPHYRIGGKILIRRSEFDAWAGRFKVQTKVVSFDSLVDEVLSGLR